jgi:hypothetical protein
MGLSQQFLRSSLERASIKLMTMSAHIDVLGATDIRLATCCLVILGIILLSLLPVYAQSK